MRSIQLRYNFRCYPDESQQAALARAFGCARVVFNDALDARQRACAAGHWISDAELSRRLTAAKRTAERAWLADVSAVVLQQALADLNTAYRNFFASATGRRLGPTVGLPKFRSRHDRQSIRFTRNAHFAVTAGGRLRLPKIGAVKVVWSRPLPAEPTSVTVIRDTAGRYFASFVVESTADPLPEQSAQVGIARGTGTVAVLSNGATIAHPEFLRRSQRRLDRARRTLSRKQLGSKNQLEARLAVAKALAALNDTRRDWAHKQSTAIIRENQAVYIEGLPYRAKAPSRRTRSTDDDSWIVLARMLDQKAARYGRRFGKVSPSPAPGPHHPDRAARTILAAGQAESRNACGADKRPGPVLALGHETGTRRRRYPRQTESSLPAGARHEDAKTRTPTHR
ncbi:RNA-guided endonuclease InsQ/TnpB family protein [Nocardia brasiliensis]|uniref:RNA-guided endonuclease InsQ/TnpB family protein n=1 Tax=Nocardia brasiliensis TaxID=37326 RepID=UPI001895CC52|nr:RNA-guided endonuclease TnpB family protein [Nocardia brasiliensis]MBF6127058.1 transposase [Nocardia brasiliensis]